MNVSNNKNRNLLYYTALFMILWFLQLPPETAVFLVFWPVFFNKLNSTLFGDWGEWFNAAFPVYRLPLFIGQAFTLEHQYREVGQIPFYFRTSQKVLRWVVLAWNAGARTNLGLSPLPVSQWQQSIRTPPPWTHLETMEGKWWPDTRKGTTVVMRFTSPVLCIHKTHGKGLLYLMSVNDILVSIKFMFLISYLDF